MKFIRKPFYKTEKSQQLFESLRSARHKYPNISKFWFDKFLQTDKSKTYKYIEKMCELFTQGYEDFIDRIESGENKGIPLKQNMFFSNIINGINTGITLVCAHSGQGKSSSIVSFILDLANQNKKCVILANEEDAYTWQKKLVASVISNGYIQP